MKNYKKQLFFDATSLARQLQRAKRAIKFLVKEEKRFIQQNDKLSEEVFELTKTNQLLENSTLTADGSVETLEAEIKQLEEENQSLKVHLKELREKTQQLTRECIETDKKGCAEKQRKENLQSCMARIQERADEFLRQDPSLTYELFSGNAPPSSPPPQSKLQNELDPPHNDSSVSEQNYRLESTERTQTQIAA